MSFAQSAPWTPSEKVDLLVNVLRSNVPDLPFFLMQVLQEKGIYPKWTDTPLPTGRSLASSQIVYEEISRPFKQQGSYSVQPVNVGHAPTIAPAAPSRRPYPEYEPYGSQQQQPQRTLQPRPPRSTDSPIPAVTNGETSSIIRPIAMSEPLQEPQRKKRGRPSKEEAEERDRALAAEGKVYQPKKRPAKKIRPSLETPFSTQASDFTPRSAHTPRHRTPETKDEGSSGKKKQRRQIREETDPVEKPLTDLVGSLPPGGRSPSDRLLATHRERELDMLLNKDIPKSPSETTIKTTGDRGQ